MHGTGDFVQIVLDAGADPNCELLNGRKPLHIAAEFGNLQAAECLVKQSQTNRSAKDRFGTTPLLLVAQHGNKEIAEMLAPWNRTNELSQDEIEASK
jgi:ankyrin repeat protein